jgi:predicted nucleic acid-binding protein
MSEPGSKTVEAVCSPTSGNTLLLAHLTSVEMASALSRKARMGALAETTAAALWASFKIDWQRHYHIIALTDVVSRHAERIIFAHPLRSFDAVQVATAIVAASQLVRSDVEFWTADRRQAQAAATEGLSVELVG